MNLSHNQAQDYDREMTRYTQKTKQENALDCDARMGYACYDARRWGVGADKIPTRVGLQKKPNPGLSQGSGCFFGVDGNPYFLGKAKIASSYLPLISIAEIEIFCMVWPAILDSRKKGNIMPFTS